MAPGIMHGSAYVWTIGLQFAKGSATQFGLEFKYCVSIDQKDRERERETHLPLRNVICENPNPSTFQMGSVAAKSLVLWAGETKLRFLLFYVFLFLRWSLLRVHKK